MPGTHDRTIADAAKAALGPLGFRRKGRSRTWLADHGWWLNVVEFQPSSWSKGSYLNVAAHWLWSESGSLGFDFGGRIMKYVEYVTDDQFKHAATELADGAAVEARRLADLFDSFSGTAKILLDLAQTAGAQPHLHPGWSDYHAGVAAAVVGQSIGARKCFNAILDSSAPPGSVLYLAAERMARRLGDPAGLREDVLSLIHRQREALGLSPLKANPF